MTRSVNKGYYVLLTVNKKILVDVAGKKNVEGVY